MGGIPIIVYLNTDAIFVFFFINGRTPNYRGKNLITFFSNLLLNIIWVCYTMDSTIVFLAD